MNSSPINFQGWVETYKSKLQPPVNNYCIQQGKDFVVMAIGGPNKRTDFHINETEANLISDIGMVLPNQREYAAQDCRRWWI